MPDSDFHQRRPGIFLLFLLALTLFACKGVEDIVVKPVRIDDTLLNPGRGFATTHVFNNSLGERLHPRCTVSQFRWYWNELEPEEGRIDFRMIDSLLAQAHENGQKINFRIMCQNGHPGVPQWVREAGAKGQPYRDDPKNWQPHYNDPVFLDKHSRFIAALAERYDGHPDVDCVDIGTVGRWGEWHTGGTGMDMPDDSTRKRVVDMYLDNFRKTPLLMLIGAEYGLKYAVEHGAGWRADCLGDMGGFSEDWNHMKDMYPQAIMAAGAEDAWKTAPVVFETCWTMQFWYDKGWDLDLILSRALEWHVSILNNGTESIPEPWWPRVQEFEKRMGYRFRLVRLQHPSAVRAGGLMFFEMDWENEGVAPCYLNYPPSFQLRNTETGAAWELHPGLDATTWLPGPNLIQSSIAIPTDIPDGLYELGVALLDPFTGKPRILLANEGLDEDGWYRFSEIKIR